MGDHHQGVSIELVFDFDGTITTEDTIASIAEAAIRVSPRKEMASAWDYIVRSYVEDMEHYHRTYVAPDGSSPEEPLQVLLDRYSGCQRRHVESASLARVKDAGLFQGIWPDYLLRAGQLDKAKCQVRIREGFDWFFKHAQLQGHGMHILSVNWSIDYIKGVLGTRYDMTSVIANRTDPEDGSISTSGAFEESNDREAWPDVLAVANDKLVAMRNLYRRRKASNPGKELIFIYFGDSTTDVECLIEVGGVIISNGEGSLLQLLQQYIGHQVPHVSEWEEDGLTCWARNFSELQQFDYITRRVVAAEKNNARPQRSIVGQ